ncbi:MAG: hypothetical protein U0359_06015 [Byssovorax sp.]
MSCVSERPSGAKRPDSSTEPPHPPIDFGDPAAVRAWLSFLREHTLDAIALGEDAMKRPRERMFSRHEAGRRLASEERVLLALLDAAERGLAPARAADPT